MKSNKQTEILEFIQYKIENEGYSPSIREIAEKVNLKSTSSVHHHLNNLIEKGLLSKKAKQPRTIGKRYLIPANKNYNNQEINSNIQPIGKVVSLFRDI